MRKSTLLLVSSIVILLRGILAIPGTMMILGNGNQYMAQSDAGVFKIITLTLTAIGLADVLVSLISGILGIRNYKVPEKAGICIKFGAANIAIQTFGILLNVIASTFQTTTLLLLLFPVLYFIGARQLLAQASQ